MHNPEEQGEGRQAAPAANMANTELGAQRNCNGQTRPTISLGSVSKHLPLGSKSKHLDQINCGMNGRQKRLEEVIARLLLFLIGGVGGRVGLARQGLPWGALCPWRPLGFPPQAEGTGTCG